MTLSFISHRLIRHNGIKLETNKPTWNIFVTFIYRINGCDFSFHREADGFFFDAT